MGTGLRSPVGGASRRLWRLLAASTALIAGLVLLALAGCGTGSSGASHQSGARLQAEHAYGRLPLAFVPNRGQLDARALYVARGAGYSLFLTKRSAVLSLAGGKAGQKPSRSAALALGFVGANPAARVQAESGLPGTVNYLIGRDRARWHTNIPTYGRVGYRNLWPGIDAVFYGNQGRLEYDFDVAPGADTRRIGLSLAGATRIRPLQSGALLIELPGGSVRQLTPHSYQVVGGRKRQVASRYVLRGNRVSVRVGSYDRSLPLVIDPALAYATYLGGSGDDEAGGQHSSVSDGNAIAVDSAGAAYVTGYTESTDFPHTTGAYQTSYQGQRDAFVTKVAPDGKSFAYSTYLGGTNYDQALGIAVDSGGAAYVTGYTNSTDFPTQNAYQSSLSGSGPDAFVSKLAANGQLTYSTYLGGSGNEWGEGIAVNSSGVIYVTGTTNSFSPAFPTTAGAYQTSLAGGYDAFLTKLDPSATGSNQLVYSTYLGGSPGYDQGTGIALDSAGVAYLTGYTESTNFPTMNAYQGSNAGPSDVFVTKLNPAGTGSGDLLYSTYLGGDQRDAGEGIAVDSSGAIYVTGQTSSTDFATTKFPTTNGAYQPSTSGHGYDTFVSKLDPNATPSSNQLKYSTLLSGAGSDRAYGLALDSSGDAYVAGDTDSTDYPTKDAYQATKPSSEDAAFVTELNPGGTDLVFSTYLGGSDVNIPMGTGHGSQAADGIALDSSGAIYVAGWTTATNFPVTSGAAQTSKGAPSGYDAFVAKFGSTTGGGGTGGGGGPPVNVTRPVISGTPLPDHNLTCSQGTWVNNPTSFKRQWKSNGASILGATSTTYTVRVADRGATLTCSVTATNAFGSATATSGGVLVAVPGTLTCPRPSGRLTTSRAGPLSLGESRKAARRALKRFTKHNNQDDFCLFAGWGIRAFYPSSRTLSLVGGHQGLKGRIVIALSANPFYTFQGIRPGASLKDAKRKLRLGRVHHIGLNDWYFNSKGNVLVKVRHQTILEIGPANRLFTHGYKRQQKFLNSFGSF